MTASLSPAMRRVGWVLATGMLLYPIDTALAWWTVPELRAAEPGSVGLQMMTIHCGPLGWAGAWASLLGLLWLAVAIPRSIAGRHVGNRFAGATWRVLLAVGAGLLLVASAVLFDSRVGVI